MAIPMAMLLGSRKSWYVSLRTSAVMRREEEIEPLIDVNKIIMQGLAGREAA